MVAISVWAIALLATIGVTSAADPIHFPLRRTEGYHKSLNRRASASSVELYNAARQGGYGIDLTIGTPGIFTRFSQITQSKISIFSSLFVFGLGSGDDPPNLASKLPLGFHFTPLSQILLLPSGPPLLISLRFPFSSKLYRHY